MYALILMLALACEAPPPAAPVVAPEPPPPPPEPTCDAVNSPFLEVDRRSLAVLKKRFDSGFGDYRSSYIAGHRHAGLDLRTRYGEGVYAICAGVVDNIHLGSPHRTVVVRHHLPDGSTRWSSYKHVEDVMVQAGERVTADTRIGRVFTQDEQAHAGWKLNHLHFEWRTSIDDGGAASWSSMSQDELTRYAADPRAMFEAALAPASAPTRR